MSLRTNLEYWKLKMKNEPLEVINNALDKIMKGITVVGKAAAIVYPAVSDEDSSNCPKLSDEAYNRFEVYLGTSKADEVKRDVESGRMDVKEAEEWSQKIEQNYEQSSGRRSIEPEEWQDFEEGWRPDGW